MLFPSVLKGGICSGSRKLWPRAYGLQVRGATARSVGPAPAMMALEGGSVGSSKCGGQATDLVLLIMRMNGAQVPILESKVKLGGDASVSGRSSGTRCSCECRRIYGAFVKPHIRVHGVFSRAISLEGSTLRPDNVSLPVADVYGRKLTAERNHSGGVEVGIPESGRLPGRRVLQETFATG